MDKRIQKRINMEWNVTGMFLIHNNFLNITLSTVVRAPLNKKKTNFVNDTSVLDEVNCANHHWRRKITNSVTEKATKSVHTELSLCSIEVTFVS